MEWVDLDELAAYPGVVAVGAVDKAGKVWEKSNYGSQTMLTAPGYTHSVCGGIQAVSVGKWNI